MRFHPGTDVRGERAMRLSVADAWGCYTFHKGYPRRKGGRGAFAAASPVLDEDPLEKRQCQMSDI